MNLAARDRHADCLVARKRSIQVWSTGISKSKFKKANFVAKDDDDWCTDQGIFIGGSCLAPEILTCSAGCPTTRRRDRGRSQLNHDAETFDAKRRD